MGLGGPLLRRTQTRTLSLHGEIGFGLGYVNEQARTRRTTLLQGAIALKERSAERAERARVLYVAMTRPKVRLVLVGSMKNPDAARTGRSGGVYGVREAHSMLDWLLQSAQPCDSVTVEREGQLSTFDMRETGINPESPQYPQVFHRKVPPGASFSTWSQSSQDIWPARAPHCPFRYQRYRGRVAAKASPLRRSPGWIGPWPPGRRIEKRTAPRPLKLGVTALCRALDGAQTLSEAAEEEEEQLKRLPYEGPRPRLLAPLPAMPAFLEPPREEEGLLRGVQTHRLLGLMDLEGARAAKGNEKALFFDIKSELARLVEKRVMTPAEAELADVRMAARFLTGPLGQRMLAASMVRREWSFNLHVEEPFPTLLQGVIDLLFRKMAHGCWWISKRTAWPLRTSCGSAMAGRFPTTGRRCWRGPPGR